MTGATPVGAILDALFRKTGKVPRANGGKWQACCPAHDDSSPSLSISLGDDGRALVHCFAGCGWREVLAALDVGASDLFPEDSRTLSETTNGDDRWTPRGPWLESYVYADAGGREVFTVHRVEAVDSGGRRHKEFPVARPDASAKSGRRWNLEGITRVPYRLPELRLAIRENQTVWVAEGERDVAALVAAGCAATTLPGGGPGGGWRPEYAEHFRGADVAVVADDDTPGRRRAEITVAGLIPVVASLSLLLPLVGKDARDHLEAGHTVAEFRLVDRPVDRAIDPQPAAGVAS